MTSGLYSLQPAHQPRFKFQVYAPLEGYCTGGKRDGLTHANGRKELRQSRSQNQINSALEGCGNTPAAVRVRIAVHCVLSSQEDASPDYPISTAAALEFFTGSGPADVFVSFLFLFSRGAAVNNPEPAILISPTVICPLGPNERPTRLAISSFYQGLGQPEFVGADPTGGKKYKSWNNTCIRIMTPYTHHPRYDPSGCNVMPDDGECILLTRDPRLGEGRDASGKYSRRKRNNEHNMQCMQHMGLSAIAGLR